jgi:hypothetical protein
MNLPVSSYIPVNCQCADYGQEHTQGLRENTTLPPADLPDTRIITHESLHGWQLAM